MYLMDYSDNYYVRTKAYNLQVFFNNFSTNESDTKGRKITRNCYNDKNQIFYLTYVTEGNIKALSNVTNKNCPASASMKPFNFLYFENLTMALHIIAILKLG